MVIPPALRYAVVRILHSFDDPVIFLYLEHEFNIMDQILPAPPAVGKPAATCNPPTLPICRK